MTYLIIICQDCEMLAQDTSDDGDELCDNCLQNRAEAAWERHCEDPGPSFQEQYVAAWEQSRRLKS